MKEMKTIIVCAMLLFSISVFAEDIEETKMEGYKKLCVFIREMDYVANTQFNLCNNLNTVSGKNPSTFTYSEINKYAFLNSLDLITNAVDIKGVGIANGIIDKCWNGLNSMNTLRSVLPVCK